jgi:hypothetical protein
MLVIFYWGDHGYLIIVKCMMGVRIWIPPIDGRNGKILTQAFPNLTRLDEIDDIITLGLYPIKETQSNLHK